MCPDFFILLQHLFKRIENGHSRYCTPESTKAWKIVEATRIIPIWESIGAKVNLVGSLRTGLLMKHRDIDFHVYTSEISLSDSFRAMAELAANTSVKKIECVNLLHTVEACIEWHAWCEDGEENFGKSI